MSATRETLNSVNLRLPRAMLERAEALRKHASRARELATAPTVTRSDVLRLAMLRGLEALEEEMDEIVDREMLRESERRLMDPAEQERIPLEDVLRRHGL